MLKTVFLFIIVLWPQALRAREKKIVFFGDSLTAGFGLPEDQSFPSQIQTFLKRDGINWVVVNAGITGDTTSGALRRLTWVMKSSPDAVFVALGANDGLRGMETSLIKKNLQIIVKRFKEARVKVILAGVLLPVNYGEDYTKSFRQVYVDLAKKERLDFYPFLLEGVAMDKKLNLSDGIHPNEAGQKIVAERVYEFLKPVLWNKKL